MQRKRHPIRAHGAIVINPKHKPRARRNASAKRKPAKPARRRNAAAKRKSPAKRKASRTRHQRRRAADVNSVVVHYTDRTGRPAAKTITQRSNPLALRPNPRHAAPPVMTTKRKRRKTPRKRKNALAVRTNGMARELGKVPLIGPFLAGAVSVFGSAAVGAVSVEPQLLVNRGLARIYPSMPASLAHAASGLVLGGLTIWLLPKTKMVKPQTAQMLAAAMAAGGGAVGYYIMRTDQDSSVDSALGALSLRGLSSPLAGVGQMLGRSHDDYGMISAYDHTYGAPQAGAYGFAEAVYPANAMPQAHNMPVGKVMSAGRIT